MLEIKAVAWCLGQLQGIQHDCCIARCVYAGRGHRIVGSGGGTLL